MKYLADENVIRATKSATAAIIFESIAYYVADTQSRCEKWKYHDGRYWIYNTRSSWCKQYRCFTEKTIRTALARLTEVGLITTAHFYKSKMKNTTWYTLTPKGWAILKEPQLERENTIPPKKEGTTYAEKPLFKNEELQEAWDAFAESRKAAHRQMTEPAKKMLLAKLEKIASNDTEKIEILNRSIRCGYPDVYPLKKQQSQSNISTDGEESFPQELKELVDNDDPYFGGEKGNTANE